METTTSPVPATAHPAATCHSPTSRPHMSSVLEVGASASLPLELGTNHAVNQQLRENRLDSSDSSSPPLSRTPDSCIEGNSQRSTEENYKPSAVSPPPVTSHTNTSLHTTKNKRKNFNPRCSATDGLSNDPTYSTTNFPSDGINNSINKSTDVIMKNTSQVDDSVLSYLRESQADMSANWQRLIAENRTAHDHEDAEEKDDKTNVEQDTSPMPTMGISNLGDIEGNKFYNIPNTNFSIAKTQAAFVAAAAAAAASAATASSNSTGTIDGSDVGFTLQQKLAAARTSDALSQLQQTQSLLSQHHANQSNDTQSPLQFACNAFNAVQELLNVYGLSISPNDIVDAFKKQATVGKSNTLTHTHTAISIL